MENTINNTTPVQFKDQESRSNDVNKILRFTAIGLAILIIVFAVIKYVIYLRPEKISYDSRARMITEVNPDLSLLQAMQFNEDLLVGCQPILIADSRDNSVNLDFVVPDSTKVIVRAEIFVSKDNVNSRPVRKFWTDLFAPDDDSMVRIGSTGWVRPGEMITKIELDELPYKMSDISVRFTAVNPANEKISAGEFSMNTIMHVVDYEGNMLDENGNWVAAG